MYSSVKQLEELDGKKVDLVVCCGDFQSVRNLDDLQCMACPVKYRKLGSFHEYYSGAKKAPYPTVFGTPDNLGDITRGTLILTNESLSLMQLEEIMRQLII